MPANIKIELDDEEALAALRHIHQAGHNLAPLMRRIAELMRDGVQQSFEREQAPDGTPWPAIQSQFFGDRIDGQSQL